VITSASVPIPGSNWGIWSHAFQGANTTWLFDQRQIAGNFFLGLQGSTVNIFDAGIPRGAIIESAVMRVTAYQPSGSVFTTNLNTVARDASLIRRPLLSPLTHFVGWRPDQWSNASMVLLNTTFGTIATTGAADNAFWIMRQIQASTSPYAVVATPNRGHRERMAQGFTVPAAGNTQILNATLLLYRQGLPIGNVRVHIYAAILDSDGVTLVPDDISGPLATSNDLSMDGLTTAAAGANETFQFTGADQIVLTPSADYFLVIVPDAYAINNTAWIAMRHQNTFLSAGRLMHFGEGIGLDWQNFPGNVDAFVAFNNSPSSVSVPWVPAAFNFAGQNHVTPDVSQLVQDQVNDPNYGEDLGIAITTILNGGGTPNRVWRSAVHASNTPPRLDVTYRRRRVGVS